VNLTPRVGEEVICRPQVDVVDTQGLEALPWSFFHRYIFENDLLLSDMGMLIQQSDPPAARAHVQAKRRPLYLANGAPMKRATAFVYLWPLSAEPAHSHPIAAT
jgi:hypothetical protein